MTIKEQIDQLKEQQGKINNKITELQQTCKHENAVGEYGSNYRNWDPNDDTYWLDISCLDCYKKYRLYSTDPGYRGFRGKIKGN